MSIALGAQPTRGPGGTARMTSALAPLHILKQPWAFPSGKFPTRGFETDQEPCTDIPSCTSRPVALRRQWKRHSFSKTPVAHPTRKHEVRKTLKCNVCDAAWQVAVAHIRAADIVRVPIDIMPVMAAEHTIHAYGSRRDMKTTSMSVQAHRS